VRYEVVLTKDAERDLEQIHRHIAEHDSRVNADYVLDRLLQTGNTFAEDPQRGSVLKELRALGMTEYRQVFFKPYRLIYRVHEARVVVYLIADGRRDMQSLLVSRLLGN